MQRAHPWASTLGHTGWFINHQPLEMTGTPLSPVGEAGGDAGFECFAGSALLG